MANIFIDLFNMSITASYFVLAIVLFRLIFKKAPKWINCILWALVGLRLVIPFSIESDFSFLPSTHTVSTNKASSGLPFSMESGIFAIDANVNNYLRSHYYEGVTVPENTFVDMVSVLAIIWLIGVALMLVYSAISFIRLKRQVSVSLLYRDNIYYCDTIETPFILGIVRPKIYIPSGLNEDKIENVVMHENAHLKRKDHWWKPLGFLILAFYWFNPVIWLAYILLCRDIEKACDEKVIKNMNTEEKKGYLEALVDCSVQRKMVLACPVAFGEVGVKQRIKAVLNYRKPAFWVIVVAVIVTVAVSVGFLTNPSNSGGNTDIAIIGGADGPTSIIVSDKNTKKEIKKLQEKYPHFFNLDDSNGLTVYVTALGLENYRWYLSSNKNPVDPQKIMDFKEFAIDYEMIKILSAYDINDVDIEVVPFQHSLSSFLWDYQQGDAENESEYLRSLIGLSSMNDSSLKTFNATVVDFDRQGIIVEPFEGEPEKEVGRILLQDIFSDVINDKIRVVYEGRIKHIPYAYSYRINSVRGVYGISDEKKNLKVVNIDIDKNLFGSYYDETSFLKEMEEYGARVNQSVDSEKYSVIFSETQYNDFLKDKYKQVELYYKSIEESEEDFVFKKVEYDEDFRNLKIYVDESQRQYISSIPEYGIAQTAFSYQLFLPEGLGMNVFVIDYENNEVVWSFTLPEKND